MILMFENNRITKLLGIKYPIIQGGMAWVADADLAAAVSNAGGLGVLAGGNLTKEQAKKEMGEILRKGIKTGGKSKDSGN